MAYFAKIENGVVTNVIRIENDVIGEDSILFPDTEQIGQAFIVDVLGLEGEWRQTSFNATFRYNYAGLGYEFDSSVGEHGAFYTAQPYPSWTLDGQMQWQPPVPYPSDGEGPYIWDEDTVSWVALNP